LLVQLVLTWGLVFFGWGIDDVRGFFAQPARTGLLVVGLVGMVLAVVVFPDVRPFRKGKQVVGRSVFAEWIVIVLLLVWFVPFADRRGLFVLSDADALRYLGLALTLVGGTVRMVALTSLGKQFSGYVTLQEDHQLVQTGIYIVIRHPMYLGILLTMPGFALVFRSWLAVPIFLASAIFVALRIRQEEKLLAQSFGEEFVAYRQRTWRLLPLVY
jgi:protein-S-isoprenylcysteine O-methyltransferase Ste14